MPEHFRLSEVASEVLAIFGFTATQKGIKLSLQNKLVNETIFNDARRFKQVLINLISNALKFTE